MRTGFFLIRQNLAEPIPKDTFEALLRRRLLVQIEGDSPIETVLHFEFDHPTRPRYGEIYGFVFAASPLLARVGEMVRPTAKPTEGKWRQVHLFRRFSGWIRTA